MQNVRRIASFLFLISGASGLLFETLWTYQASLALGSSSSAVMAVLSAFMGGLAFGNLLALRRPVWSLKTYAILEGTILVTGLAALALLPVLGRLLAPLMGALEGHPALVNLVRFAAAFVVLAVPSTAMGMTLPALAQALGGEQGSFRSVLGRLYGLNTLGAIAGVLGAEVLLLPGVGVFGTGLVAALLNGAAAVGAWRLGGIAPAPTEPAWDRRIPRSLIPLLVPVFLAGFALLGLEVVWTRFLALYVRNLSLSFALMLATVLSGIALGGALGGLPWIRKPFACLLLFGAGAMLVAVYAAFPLYHPSPEAVINDLPGILFVGFVLQFPVSLLSGAFFTLAGAEFRDRIATSQAATGLLVLVNTLGAAVGAGVTGLLFVPGLGIEKSFFVFALAYGVAALVWGLAAGAPRRWLLGSLAAWLAVLAFFPFGDFERRHLAAAAARWKLLPDSRIAGVREGLTETSILVEAREFDRPYCYRLITNAHSMSGNTIASDRYMKQFVYWPVALHPKPRRALLVCFGVGSTAQALTRTRELEKIDMVDLSREILDLGDLVFPDPATHPLKDPRVSVHVEDGRYFLQTRNETWDIITGEPPPPMNPGMAGLYSREYFQLLRDHLSEGGIATYWLPLHNLSEAASLSILKAWIDVFGDSFLWRGSNRDLMIAGFRGRRPAVDEARFSAQWSDPVVKADLADVGLDVPGLLGTGYIADGERLRAQCAGAEPAVDAFPKRIVAPGVPGARELLYEDWYDVQASADRFRKSPAVAALWPPGIRETTLALFEWETVLTSIGGVGPKAGFADFPELHRLLQETPLRTPALWMLGSDRDHVRAARQSAAAQQALPPAQFHLGAQALSQRDYAAAADHFLRTIGKPEMRRIDLAAGLYALCRAGRRPEAERALASVWDPVKMKAIPPAYWTWMQAAFGLKTP